MQYWRYRRRFDVDGIAGETVIAIGFKTVDSVLRVDGVEVARDSTPATGPESVRNHHLAHILPDGRRLEVEAGYVSWWSMGVAVRLDGTLVHESHPGTTIAYPVKLREFAERSTDPGDHFKRNGPAIAVDIALGLLFFVVAKAFGLTEAALVGAAAGVALLVIQRFVKVDIVGGLALFGVATLLLSAGYAWLVQDEELIKLRTTVVGLIAATLFITDGVFGGRWLGKGLSRYMPMEGLNLGRLSLGVGALGATMALLNLLVARTLPTDVWLFYTTFGDIAVAMILFWLVLHYARSGPKPTTAG